MLQGTPVELADFPVTIRLPVQWGDQDPFGHVNNATYFRWYESARIAYLEKIGLSGVREEDQLGPILAAISCNYRRQIKYPDQVVIGTRVTRMGRTSITMEHKLWSREHNAIAADGQGTVVVFDYRAGQPRAAPEFLRAALEKLEGRPLSGG
jgi:acyl-CoA thioester hydrolase